MIDQYVMGLAVAATPCFGYHDAGATVCGDCPVAAACASSWRIRAATVADQITKAERSRARRPAPPAPPPPPVTESIDDIIASIDKNVVVAAPPPAPPVVEDLTTLFGDLLAPSPAPPPSPAPAPPSPAPAASAPRVTMMKAVIESVCFSCGQKIPAQTMAAFIPGKGVRHPGCP
jgi:hypothetical protein